VALAVALIFLVIMGGIAVFLAKRSNLELRMASNTISKATTFERAEGALPTAEAMTGALADGISSGKSLFNCGTPGYYALPGVTGTIGTCKALSVSALTWTSTDTQASANGRYAIEYRGKDSVILPQDRYVLPVVLTEVYHFRIVSRGSAEGGRTVLETVRLSRSSG